MIESRVGRPDNGRDDLLKALLFPFLASFFRCALALADFIGEIIQSLISAAAIGGRIKLRRIGDVEAGDFVSECSHGGDRKV